MARFPKLSGPACGSYPTKTLQKLCKIVEEKQAAKVDGTLVDLFTASAITQVYDKLNNANKAKFAAMPIKQMAAVTWKLIK